MYNIHATKNDGTSLSVQGKTMAEAADKLRGFQADRVDFSFSFTVDNIAEAKAIPAAMPVALECLAGSSGYVPGA